MKEPCGRLFSPYSSDEIVFFAFDTFIAVLARVALTWSGLLSYHGMHIATILLSHAEAEQSCTYNSIIHLVENIDKKEAVLFLKEHTIEIAERNKS